MCIWGHCPVGTPYCVHVLMFVVWWLEVIVFIKTCADVCCTIILLEKRTVQRNKWKPNSATSWLSKQVRQKLHTEYQVRVGEAKTESEWQAGLGNKQQTKSVANKTEQEQVLESGELQRAVVGKNRLQDRTSGNSSGMREEMAAGKVRSSRSVMN